jgi:hypothetical protein
MKGSLALCCLAGLAVMVSTSQSFAQSGVFSGPPQVRPGSKDPGLGPDYRPGQGPNYRPDPGPGPGPGLGPDYRPGQGPNVRRQDETWIAVAAGFDASGQRVSVGYSGHKRSRFDAEDAAMRECERNAPNVRCRGNPKGLLAVSTGCLYIVPGNRSGGGVRWGRGGTRQAAFEECRRGGFTCPSNKLIGGCVPGYR